MSRILTAAACLLFCAGLANGAITLDLTAGGDGFINGAYFITVDQQSTGTGVIDSFVRLQANGTEEGYNADARPVMSDVNTSPQFTRDLRIMDIPVVANPGNATGNYLEFLLDVNQTNANPLISLDEIRVFTRGTAIGDASTLASLTGSSIERYNLDAGSDNGISLDYSLNSGSGSGDMIMYLPTSAFAAAGANDFIYLYSSFGADHATNAGFEEWAVRSADGVIPEPSAIAVWSLLGCIACAVRCRFGK